KKRPATSAGTESSRCPKFSVTSLRSSRRWRPEPHADEPGYPQHRLAARLARERRNAERRRVGRVSAAADGDGARLLEGEGPGRHRGRRTDSGAEEPTVGGDRRQDPEVGGGDRQRADTFHRVIR